MENSKVSTQFFTKRVEVLNLNMKRKKQISKKSVKVKDLSYAQINIDYSEIKRIKATVRGYFGKAFTVDLNLENYQGVWAQESGTYDETVITFSNEECEKFRDELKNTNILHWNPKYEKANLVGGNKWSVQILTEEGKICKSGSNKFPKEFGLFCKLIEEVCGQTFEIPC
ncbi:hypothetical protein BKP37_04670 [Anaerobacillus alkalilacustris]|uniref:Uncharacterized protein n=1 Tax=Anaerobacillus alkalilacustris TaxID=393763 RepID=A0A1S2LWC6_9BACI|nr:hypothetical protein [Anaerobacillus alkalilacustris]OIJ16828.1 hypothetical protein BKP37_04670 [Anaerobacillus alkalilacustris]